MIIVKELEINISGRNEFDPIFCVQGENLSRVVQIALRDGDEYLKIHESYIVKAIMIKASKKTGIYDSVIVDQNDNEKSKIFVTLTKEMLSDSGEAYMYLLITNTQGEEILKTPSICLYVNPSRTNNDEITNSSEYQSFVEGLKALEKIKVDFSLLKERTPYCYDTIKEMQLADDIKVHNFIMTFGTDDIGDGGGKVWLTYDPDSQIPEGESYVLANGLIAVGLSGFGGGGSGGGATLPTITSDFSETSCDSGGTLTIPFFFQTPNTGRGIVHVTINGVEAKTEEVKTGQCTVTTPALTKGKNTIKIYVTDRAGLYSNELTWIIQCGSLEISSSFNSEKDYVTTDSIKFNFNIDTISSDSIQVLFRIDNDEYRIEANSGYNTYTLPQLGFGVHKMEVQAFSGEYVSNKLTYNVVVIDSDTLYVSTQFTQESAEEGEKIILDYRISMKGETDFNATYFVDNVEYKKATARSGQNYWIISDLIEGSHQLKIHVETTDASHEADLEISINITPSAYEAIDPVTQGLVAWYKMSEGSNSDIDKETLKDKSGNGNNAHLYNFNYSSNGYIDGALKCNGKAYAEVPLTPFSDNAEYGLTIDVQFKMRDIGDTEAKVIYCRDSTSPKTGIEINTLNAMLVSMKQSLKSVITEEEKTRITFVIDRDEKLMSLYVNAIRCEVAQLTDIGSILESFSNESTLLINAGWDSNNEEIEHQGSCEIYNLRIYQRALTSEEVLQNHISDIEDRAEQQKKYDVNYNDAMPTMYFVGDMSGMSKDNAKEIEVKYIPAGIGHGEAFDYKKCKVSWQGTSSLQYPVKNYKIKLYDDAGNKVKYTPFGEDSIKESTFCLKADMMSSAHFENTGAAKMINDAPYTEMTPPKAINSNVRHTINGFPIQLYVNGEWAGVYNFNNDKGNTDTFGLDTEQFPQCLSYEVAANSDSTAGAFVKWNENSGISELEYFQKDFELRYPDEDVVGSDYGYLTSLKRLVDFVSDASDEDFKAHLNEYMNIEYTLFYYLQVFVFGMVDNLGKNMMLSTWDGNIWYPQFYDLDTQMGLNNTGRVTFDSDIEMEAGTFNTSASRLWTKFQRCFEDEIKARYAELRSNYFTIDNIMKYLYTEQAAAIGERQYNMDSEAKYIAHQEYLFMAHGNRLEYVKRWLNERILYLDTKLEFKGDTEQSITIRVNHQGLVSFAIQMYSPQFVKVKWRNGEEEVKRIGRDEVVSFSYDMPTATDQEVIIYNAKYIKSLGDLSSMSPTELLIGNAIKLTELICTNADSLGSVTLPKNSFLQKIDLSGCSALGESVGGTTAMAVMNVSECENLKYLDARETSLTSIVANPEGGNIEYIFYPWTIQEVDLRNQYALKAAIIPFNEYPLRYSAVQNVTLINCPLLTTIYSIDDYNQKLSPINKALNVEIRNTGLPSMSYTQNGTKEYGVRRLVGSKRCEWERVYKIDGVMKVGIDTDLEAYAGVGDETVRNDFDSIEPWSKIKDVSINGRRMTEYPKFYIKHNTEDGYEYWWICMKKLASYRLPHVFIKPDGTEYDRFLMARYETSGNNGNQSSSGLFPIVSKTRAWYIEKALALGTGWHITTIDQYCDLLIPLFLIEFATSNTQSVMYGRAGNASGTTTQATVNQNYIVTSENTAKNFLIGEPLRITGVASAERSITEIEMLGDGNAKVYFDGDMLSVEAEVQFGSDRAMVCGTTDDVVASSGCPYSLTSSHNACIYRGIENPWGNVNKFISDINKKGKQIYWCDDFTKCANDAYTEAEGYHLIDYELGTTNGYITEIGEDQTYPWCRLPTVTDGTDTTGYADQYWYSEGGQLVFWGGNCNGGSNGGLFCCGVSYGFSVTGAYFGSRLSLSL